MMMKPEVSLLKKKIEWNKDVSYKKKPKGDEKIFIDLLHKIINRKKN